jgi:hypothetical protein
MQTIQFKVDDQYANVVLTLLKNLKQDIVKELKIQTAKHQKKSDEQIKLDKVKGILKGRITDPVAYQRALRDKWERL